MQRRTPGTRLAKRARRYRKQQQQLAFATSTSGLVVLDVTLVAKPRPCNSRIVKSASVARSQLGCPTVGWYPGTEAGRGSRGAQRAPRRLVEQRAVGVGVGALVAEGGPEAVERRLVHLGRAAGAGADAARRVGRVVRIEAREQPRLA